MSGSDAFARRAHAYAGVESAERRAGDRRQTNRFVLRERRHGWERRAQEGRRLAVLDRVYGWFRSVSWAMPAVLMAANLLSLTDIILTMRLLSSGATEANPLLRALMEYDFRLAAASKASLVAAATLLIWRYRHHRKMLPMALLAAGAFAAVVAYETVLLLV